MGIVHRGGEFSTVLGDLSTVFGSAETSCLNKYPQMWPLDWVFRIAIMGNVERDTISLYILALHLSRPMLMPVMDIGHVIVFMLFCGMLVLVGMCAYRGRIMIVSGVIMFVAVLMQ